MSTPYKPHGFTAITPYMIVEGAKECIEFMKVAFGATLTMKVDNPDGKIAHAQVQLADAILEISDASEKFPPTHQSLHLYVPSADETFAEAVAAGATPLYEPRDAYYGDRESSIMDAWGNQWFISTHLEDVSEEEMEKRKARRKHSR